jgi:hypothetical protein
VVAKRNPKKPHLLAQIVGWYGAAAIISGFLLVSFEAIKPNTIFYQLLNLSGALGLLVLGIDRHVRQSVVVNLFWISIASIALIGIVLK